MIDISAGPARPARFRHALLTALLAVALTAGAIIAPAAADVADSDSFVGWDNYATGGADITVRADQADPHGGETAVMVTASRPRSGGGGIAQDIAVARATTYEFTAWIKADGLPSATAAEIVLSTDWDTRFSIPAGTYGWTEVTWTYRTTNTQNTIPFRLVLSAPGTVWLDDITITAPASSESLVANGDFEERDGDATNPGHATLDISTPELVFTSNRATIDVLSNRANVTWVASDSTGAVHSTATAAVTRGQARITISGLQPGYYTLELTTDGPDPAQITTSFAILSRPGDAGPATQFGVVSKADQLRVAQLSAVGELGAGAMRIGVLWDKVEVEAGVYEIPGDVQRKVEELTALGIRPLLVLAYRNALYDGNRTPSTPSGIAAFAAYAAFVAEHFGTAADYEIYNEFDLASYNNSACGRTADCYLELLAPTSQAIHDAVPGATVVGGALAGIHEAWLQRFYEIGGLAHVDVISVHSYPGTYAPENITPVRIASLDALTALYNDGVPKPIWVTESGYATSTTGVRVTEDQQANYLVRDLVLNSQAGLDRQYIYETIESGPDAANREHRFGLLRNVESGVSAAAPKPAFVTVAVLAGKLAGYQPTRLEDVSAGAYSAVFTNDAGEEIRVLWATEAQTVTVQATGRVTITDRFGGVSRQVVPGTLELELTEEPIYLEGPVNRVVSPASSVYGAEIPAAAAAGEWLDITVSVDHRNSREPDPRTVTFANEDRTRRILVPSVAGELTQSVLRLPVPDAVGTMDVTIDVLVGGEVVRQISSTVTVVDNAARITVAPEVSGESAAVNVTVTNPAGAAAVVISDIDLRVGAGVARAEPGQTLEGGGSATFELSVDGLSTWTPYDATATVTFSDGLQRVVTGRTALAPVYPEGTPNAPRADLAEAGTPITLNNLGIDSPSDLSGDMWLSTTGDSITVHAVITDDTHIPAEAAGSLWGADSIQFGFVRPGGAQGSRFEFAAGQTLDGSAVVYGYAGITGVVTTATVTVDRNEDERTTTYAVTMPRSSLGIAADAAGVNYSFLVNDNDDGSRAGFIEWGSGIGQVKSVAQYLPVVFADAP